LYTDFSQPLQNNLTELISLLSFILPTVFAKNSEALKSIFKLKPTSSAGTSAALLSQQRILRAKTMMTPFVLRRRKIHVLKDLPGKTHRVEYCEMHPSQQVIYDEILQKQRDQIAARARGEIATKDVANNVLMQLRKAASHPLLFRKIFTEKKIKVMAKEIMKEDKYGTAEHSQEAIYEDMSYMWDFTLHKLCLEHASIGRFALSNEEWMVAGKVDVLKRLLPECKARGDRVLLFSFFTMMLDILEKVLDSLDVQYMRLDGQTKVDERQEMIDQFHSEEDITVFLLSTKAGNPQLPLLACLALTHGCRRFRDQSGVCKCGDYLRREFQPPR
jgi:SWI/SNF-related matrix-associated actin-dependent regulator of chromatin subfamily A containing DEAD/H box 1